MAHPPFWPFSPKSNGVSASLVSKGEKTAKIRPFFAPTTPPSNNSAVRESASYLDREGNVHLPLYQIGGRWSKIRAEG
jgi:hypothetical protein